MNPIRLFFAILGLGLNCFSLGLSLGCIRERKRLEFGQVENELKTTIHDLKSHIS